MTTDASERDTILSAIAELKDRVDRLEGAGRAGDARGASVSGSASPATAASEPSDADPFWALSELRARLGDAGGVLFTGTVPAPAGGRVEWQYGLTSEALLDRDWTDPGTVSALTALASPVRLRLLREILGGTTTVAGLSDLDGVGTSGQVYHHLGHLLAAGWLHSTARGQYAVPPARVVPLLTIVLASGGA